ncbi:MAG: hypothetical protein ACI97B_005025 [Verrucomicrobiales bacterium]|jgi:hypothetical protein
MKSGVSTFTLCTPAVHRLYTGFQIQLGELETVLALNRKQMEAAKKQTVEERKAYDQGRSPLTFVIQSRDGEAQAGNLYAQNAVQYQKLLLQYRGLRDQLLVG